MAPSTRFHLPLSLKFLPPFTEQSYLTPPLAVSTPLQILLENSLFSEFYNTFQIYFFCGQNTLVCLITTIIFRFCFASWLLSQTHYFLCPPHSVLILIIIIISHRHLLFLFPRLPDQSVVVFTPPRDHLTVLL